MVDIMVSARDSEYVSPIFWPISVIKEPQVEFLILYVGSMRTAVLKWKEETAARPLPKLPPS